MARGLPAARSTQKLAPNQQLVQTTGRNKGVTGSAVKTTTTKTLPGLDPLAQALGGTVIKDTYQSTGAAGNTSGRGQRPAIAPSRVQEYGAIAQDNAQTAMAIAGQLLPGMSQEELAQILQGGVRNANPTANIDENLAYLVKRALTTYDGKSDDFTFTPEMQTWVESLIPQMDKRAQSIRTSAVTGGSETLGQAIAPYVSMAVGALSPGLSSSFGGGTLGNVASKAVIGGTLSKISGGDFFKGALTSGALAGVGALASGLPGGSNYIDNPSAQELAAAGGEGAWTPDNIGSAMTGGAPLSNWQAPIISPSALADIGGKALVKDFAGDPNAWQGALMNVAGTAGSNALTSAGLSRPLATGTMQTGLQLASGRNPLDVLLSSGLKTAGAAYDFFNSPSAPSLSRNLDVDQVAALNGDSDMAYEDFSGSYNSGAYGPDNYDAIQYDEEGNPTYEGFSPSDEAAIGAAGNYGDGWDPQSVLAAYGNGYDDNYGTTESYFNDPSTPIYKAEDYSWTSPLINEPGRGAAPGRTPPISPSGIPGAPAPNSTAGKTFADALASMASIGKSVSSLGSAAYGLKLAGDQRKQAQQVQKAADPWGNSGGRSLADTQLQQLMRNPLEGMENDPAFKARIMAAQRATAKYGQDSGAMSVAGANAGTDWYNSRLAQLGQLAGAGQAPGAGGGYALQGTANANEMASRALASLGYGISGGGGSDMATLLMTLLKQQQGQPAGAGA